MNHKVPEGNLLTEASFRWREMSLFNEFYQAGIMLW